MAVAKNSQDLFKEIKKDFDNTFKTVIAKDLEDMYRRTVEEVVYNVYRPKKYVRRRTLLNIDSTFKSISNTTSELTIYSLGYPNTQNPEYGFVFDLLGLIEYGNGYNGNFYNMFNGDYSDHSYAKPRPFNRTAYVRASQINYQKYFK